MSEVKVVNLKNQDMMIEIDGVLIQVFPFNDDVKPHKNFGYLKDGLVYIYRGKCKKDDSMLPASMYLINKEFKFVEPAKNDRDKYSQSRISVISKENILNEIEEPDMFKKIDPKLLELNETDIFAPKIGIDDDILKRAIKEVLMKKKINLRLFRDRFKNEYDITNMKSALTKSSNMSIKYFIKWCEILDLDVKIKLAFEDSNGDGQHVEVSLK